MIKPADTESVARDWPLLGLYRLRREAPGFAIPLFRGADDTAYAQLSDGEDRIAGFLRVNISGSIVFAPPETGKPCLARVGERLSYAFHRPDGSFCVGPRDRVEEVVRADLHRLRSLPFLWLEAADFVHDAEQLRLAGIETDKLLQRTDEDAKVEAGLGGPV